MIKAIIFDWGGVLAPADTEIAAMKLSKQYSCDFDLLKQKINAYEKECSDGEDYSLFLKKIQQEFRIPSAELIKALVEIPPGEGLNIARQLSKRLKKCILSNQMQFKADYIKMNYDLSFFNHVLFSSEIGVQKPSEKAFKIILDRLNELPMNCLFVDDKLENIQIAQKLGFQVILCKNINILENGIKKVTKESI